MAKSQTPTTVFKDFLSARTVVIYTRYGVSGITYHGTAFLIEISGRALVVTAAHVVERYVEMKNAGEDTWIEISAGDGRKAVHLTGVVVAFMSRDVAPAGENRYCNRDIAFIVLSLAERNYLSKAKAFFTEGDLDTRSLSEGDGFVFFGASAGDRGADVFAPTPYIETVIRPFITTVVRVDGHHIVGEGFVKLGRGDVMMRGVSGSPVVDSAQRLRGVIFAGSEDRDEISVCAITVLLELIAAEVPPRRVCRDGDGHE